MHSFLPLLFSGLVYAAPPVVAPTTLPTGGQVVAGNATISSSATANTAVMNVNQTSQRAVVNWDSFNVGKNATVNFNQPNANAVTLNRVTGASASVIDGAIKANGQVILVNPNGVTFGKGSEVHAAAVVASTLNMADKEFMEGKANFKDDGTGVGNKAGKITNKGTIQTNNESGEGGFIALLAPEVRNQGYLLAQKGGTVAIGSGSHITLHIQGQSLVAIKVEESVYNGLISNKRIIEAPGGLVVMATGAANQLMAGVIKNTGKISANSLVNNGGVIELVASNITQAGQITTNSQAKEGGQINLSAKEITVSSNSQTTATGAAGGGQVNIGLGNTQVTGGTQTNAQAPSKQTAAQVQSLIKANADQAASTKQLAKTVTIQENATIDTSATQAGNGGTIAIWSELKTTVAGILKSMGGALSGNGGFIETSSKGQVALAPTANINTSANNQSGKAGTWLLDPIDLTIEAGAAPVVSSALSGGNVILDATGSACGSIGTCTSSLAPYIRITADIYSANASTSLSLNAIGGSISIDSNITAGQVIAVAQAININGSVNSSGGSNGQIYFAGAVINILGSIGSNGSTQGNGSSQQNGGSNSVTRRQNGLNGVLLSDTNIYTSTGGVINLIATGNINVGSSINTNAYLSANGVNGGVINIISKEGLVNHYGIIDAVGKLGSGGQIIVAGAMSTNVIGGMVSADGLSQGGLIGIGIINTNGSGSILAPPATAPPVMANFINNVANSLSGFISVNTELNAGTTISVNADNSNSNTQAGHVYIAGNLSLNTSASISANADIGGLILLSSPAGTYQNSGYIQTNGGSGLGGTIAQSGLISTILSGVTIEAMGSLGGGNIVIGRDFHSSPLAGSLSQAASLPSLANVVTLPTPRLTIVESNSTLNASAVALGNGGNILIWGDALGAYGNLAANGGLMGGNGGLLETSGNYVDTNGIVVSATSNGGFAGTWLLDPYDVYITSSASGSVFSASGSTYTYTPTEQSNITASSISDALNAGTSVTITTGAAGSNTIYVQSAISGTLVNTSLTLTAGTINISANITTVGAQTYNGNVILSGTATLNATGITGSTTYTTACNSSGTTACSAPSSTTYTVPVGVTAIQLTLVGGAGGYGGNDGRRGNQTGVSGSYTFTIAVTPGQILEIAPGGGGGGGASSAQNTGGGGAGTNALGLASGGSGGAAGQYGTSGGGGGGGAASVVQLKNSSGTVIATFYGAGAGGGGGGNNTLSPTAAGLGGTSPGLDAGQYQLASSSGAAGGKPPGSSADGGGGGGGGGGLLGGLTPPSTIRSYYNPGSGSVQSLLGCVFCNASILSLNGSGEYIGQGGNRGSNGYTVTNGQAVTVSNIIDTSYSWGVVSSPSGGSPGSNGFVKLAIPGSTGITINGSINSVVISSASLTMNSGGAIVVSGNIGAMTPLSALSISGAAVSLPAIVTTTGSQSYTGTTTIESATTLTTTNSAITFGSVVDASNHDELTIATGTGSVSFTGAVGASSALGGLTINAGSITSSAEINSNDGISFNSTGSANNIILSGLVANTGGSGTGVVVQAVGNVSMAGISNSGSLGIRVTGGYGIAAGTITGGTITGLGTVTNTGGNIAVSMSAPTSGSVSAGQAGSVEYEIGLTAANAAVGTNVTYNQVGGSYIQPTAYAAGSGYGYVNYRKSNAVSISLVLNNNYSAIYGTAYNSVSALDWLRDATNSTVTLSGGASLFGGTLTDAIARNSLYFTSAIGGVSSNNVQAATTLSTGTIRSNTGNAVTITGTARSYTIQAANLSATGTAVYSGSTSFDRSSLVVNGVNGETFTVSAGTITLANNGNVQTAQTPTSLSAIVLSGVDGSLASNYNSLTAAQTSLTITKAPLGVVVNATYQAGGTTISGSNNISLYGLVGSDSSGTASSVGLSGTGNYTTGGDLSVISIAPTSGWSMDNYAISSVATSSGGSSGVMSGGVNSGGTNTVIINKANLTITATPSLSGNVYNGNPYTGTFTTNALGSDQAAMTIAGMATGTNAGTYASNLAATGAVLSNYNAPVITNANLVISPKPIVISNVASTTTYDGVISYATLMNNAGYTLSDPLVGSDVISAMNQVASVSGNVVTGIAQAGSFMSMPSAAVLGTGNANNYIFSYAPTSNIVAKANLTITATPSLSGNVYNGNPYTGTFTTNALGSDQAAMTIAGMATGTNAGTYASNLAATGAVLSNYNAPVITNANLVISPKSITISNVASTSSYDGATSYAALMSNAGYTLSTPLVGSDAISALSQAASVSGSVVTGIAQAGSFTSTPSAAVLGVGNANNYSFSYEAAINTVSKANLAITATASLSGNVYNGNPYTGTFTTNALGSDQAAMTIAGMATGTNAGTYASNLAATGAVLSNYNAPVITNANLVIRPVPLVVKAFGMRKQEGSAFSGGNGIALIGLLDVDTPASLLGTVTYSGSSQGASAAGVYEIQPGGLSSQNYQITFVSGTLVLTQKPIVFAPVFAPPPVMVIAPPPPAAAPPVAMAAPPSGGGEGAAPPPAAAAAAAVSAASDGGAGSGALAAPPPAAPSAPPAAAAPPAASAAAGPKGAAGPAAAGSGSSAKPAGTSGSEGGKASGTGGKSSASKSERVSKYEARKLAGSKDGSSRSEGKRSGSKAGEAWAKYAGKYANGVRGGEKGGVIKDGSSKTVTANVKTSTTSAKVAPAREGKYNNMANATVNVPVNAPVIGAGVNNLPQLTAAGLPPVVGMPVDLVPPPIVLRGGDSLTQSYDDVPSIRNSGVANVGRSKTTENYHESLESVNLMSTLNLFIIR